MFRFVAVCLIELLFCQNVWPQSPSEKIKAQIEKIGVQGNLTVSTLNGEEYYGSIRVIDPARFTFDEVDQHRPITLAYAEVKRVRQGYGTTRNIYGRRIHPHTRLIVMLAVVGGLLTLVFVAVASDHS